MQTKAECVARAEQIEAEAMKQAQAWNLCGNRTKAEATLAAAREEAKIVRWLGSLHHKARAAWIIKNWSPA